MGGFCNGVGGGEGSEVIGYGYGKTLAFDTSSSITPFMIESHFYSMIASGFGQTHSPARWRLILLTTLSLDSSDDSKKKKKKKSPPAYEQVFLIDF